jgi:hypothetical protein
LDSWKNHQIPHITGISTTKEMYDGSRTLYQSVNISTKIPLRNKLTTTYMGKTNTIASYPMKLAKLRYQLGAVGDDVKDYELVRIALNGSSSYWHNFVHVIYGQKKFTNFEQLWDAFTKEEMRLEQVSTNYKDKDDVPNLALDSKVRRGRKGGLKRGHKGKDDESDSSCQRKNDLSPSARRRREYLDTSKEGMMASTPVKIPYSNLYNNLNDSSSSK